jgi:N-acetylmuramoyl-L-alanine amidase
MRNIDYIVIHCTGASQKQTVQSILNYWKNEKKWKSVGYHRLISADGTVHNLADFDKVTNGVAGFNSKSIHICYIGGKDNDERTEAQKASILNCIKEALEYEGITKKIKILGHRDFPNVKKACPQFNAIDEYSWITA